MRSGSQPQPDLLRGAEIQSLLDACIRSDAAGGASAKLAPWR